MTPTLLALLVFLALAAIVFVVGRVVMEMRAPQAVSEPRVPRLQRLTLPGEEVETTGAAGVFDRWFIPLVRGAVPDWSPMAVAALLVLWGLLCGAVLFFFDERLVPALVAGVVGMVIPVAILVFRRNQRRAQMQEQLPPALDTMARAIRAGHTLESAMQLLGQQKIGPLAKEFAACSRQLDMGLGLPAVMRSLVRRVDLYDVRVLAAALNVHRQAGGNVVELLERLAQVVRERLNYRRQVRATTAAGRMSAGLIAIVGPVVFIYFFFFQPEYAGRMVASSLGQMILGLAIVLEVVGLVWISRLLKPVY